MIKIIPKGTGFFENYDRTFGKTKEQDRREEQKTEQPKEEKKVKEEQKPKEENTQYITRQEFDEFKLKLFNILLLERSLVLNTSRLMDQVAIADERMDTVERNEETLLFDVEVSQNNVSNQFENFDTFNDIVKEQLGIKG